MAEINDIKYLIYTYCPFFDPSCRLMNFFSLSYYDIIRLELVFFIKNSIHFIGFEKILKALVEKGANVNAKNVYGNPAIFLAIYLGMGSQSVIRKQYV